MYQIRRNCCVYLLSDECNFLTPKQEKERIIQSPLFVRGAEREKPSFLKGCKDLSCVVTERVIVGRAIDLRINENAAVYPLHRANPLAAQCGFLNYRRVSWLLQRVRAISKIIYLLARNLPAGTNYCCGAHRGLTMIAIDHKLIGARPELVARPELRCA